MGYRDTKKSAKKEEVQKPRAPENTGIKSMWETYKDKSSNIMGQEGIMQFFKDWGLELSDPIVLVFSYLGETSQMCQYTEKQFTDACLNLGATKLDDLRKKHKYMMDTHMNTFNGLKKLHEWAFTYCSQGQKTVPKELYMCNFFLNLINSDVAIIV